MAFSFDVPDGLFEDENKKWNALSQTLGQQIEQLGNIQQRAQQENAAHAASLRDLERVGGLKEKGFISQQDYTDIIDKQNADLQKSGVIKSYENMTMYDELDKSRAEVRLNAWQSHMTKPEHIGAMTQPVNPTSANDVEGTWLALNKDTVLGQDLAGQDVYATPQDGSPVRVGELLAFGTGRMARKFVLEQELDKKRQARTLEVNTGLYQQQANAYLTAGATSQQMQELSTKYYGLGVDNINSLLLGAADNLMDKWATDDTLTIAEKMQKIDYLEYQLTEEVEAREGAGMFAAPGTTNNTKLTTAADNARSTVTSQQTAATKAFNAGVTAGEDAYKNTKWTELGDIVTAKKGRLTETDKANFKATILAELNDPKYASFDKKAIQLEFDGLISALDVTDSHPALMVTYLDSLNRNALDETGLLATIDTAKADFLAQKLNYNEYKEVVEDAGSKIKSVRTDAGTTLQSTLEKEGNMGWTKLPSDTLTATEDSLKTNNFQYYDQRSGTWKTAGSSDDMYFRSFQRPATKYAHELMDAGLYGNATVAAPIQPEKITQETPNTFDKAQTAYLVSQGVLEADIDYIVGELRKDFVVGDAPKTVRESRRLHRIAQERAEAYGAYQSWKQLLYFQAHPSFKSGVGKPSSIK